MVVGVNARLVLSGTLEGIGRYILETTTAMARNNPNDTFVCFFDRAFDPTFLPYNNMYGVKVWCPTRHPILILIWFEILLPIYLWRHKVNVFYSGDNFLSLTTSKPTLLVVHDLAYHYFPEGIKKGFGWFYRYFMPKYIHKAMSIVTVSAYVKETVISMFAITKRISVAYNALPNRNEKISSTYIESPYFIVVGAIHPRKNTKNILQAFLSVCENFPTVKLVLLGRLAWSTEELNEYLKHPAIVHKSNVSDQEIYSYIRNAKALIYVSQYEGFGIPILEGFYTETPVITSSLSSMPEVAGGAALLVDPKDIDGIANHMLSILHDENLAKSLVDKGRERLKDFNWDQSAKTIFEELKRICQ